MKKIYVYSALFIIICIPFAGNAMWLDMRVSALSKLARDNNYNALRAELADVTRTSNDDLSNFEGYIKNKIDERKDLLHDMSQELNSTEDFQIQKNSTEDINEVLGSFNNYINVLSFVQDEIQKRNAL